jgi:hypothetical protein
MVKITHDLGGVHVSSESKNAVLMLTNNSGGYAHLPDSAGSRYDGVFFYAFNDMYKIIESIKSSDGVKSIQHHGATVEVRRTFSTDTYFMPEHMNGLLLTTNTEKEWTLVLDAKLSYDSREYGRTYSFSEEGDCLLISFDKHNDNKDNSPDRSEYDLYLAIHSDQLEYKTIKKWIKKEYTRDQKRHSPPVTRWVYEACLLKGPKISFGFGLEKSDAIHQALRIYQDEKKLIEQKNESYEINHSSINLQALTTDQDIFAGFPWFFQHWNRDTFVSLGAHIITKNLSFAKKVLMTKINELVSQRNCDGRMKSHPTSTICTTDAAGWLFFRINHFVAESRGTPHAFSDEEMQQIVLAMEHYFTKLGEIMEDGLVYSDKDETWMDTSFQSDVRQGFCVEIQALGLAATQTYYILTGKEAPRYPAMKKAAQKFWNGTYLIDRISDPIMRPNVFIAAYVYPQLLSDAEWESCFDAILPQLWLDWGGLSSIDKSHPLFRDEHTGQTNESYHRGDSWFWVNNLAAIVLHRLNPRKYQRHINLILQASTREILYSGAIGHHAEVSSAKELRSEGCVSQAWSAALFIELIHELNKN